jgi:hypothetical protein
MNNYITPLPNDRPTRTSNGLGHYLRSGSGGLRGGSPCWAGRTRIPGEKGCTMIQYQDVAGHRLKLRWQRQRRVWLPYFRVQSVR